MSHAESRALELRIAVLQIPSNGPCQYVLLPPHGQLCTSLSKMFWIRLSNTASESSSFHGLWCTAMFRMFFGSHIAPLLCSGLSKHTSRVAFPRNATHRAKNPPITILQPSRERSCFSLFTTCRTYRRVLPVFLVLCRQPCPLFSFRPNAWLPGL